MNKGLGSTSKRSRIANYMDAFPEEFEVLEDNLGASEPSIRLQTKTREIILSCDDKGKVIEEFQLRQGAGSREEFIIKQKAYNAINGYYNDYYTGAKIIKNSFDEGELKLELADRTVTLTYDADTDSVEEKDRAKRKRMEEKEPEYKQLSLFDLPENTITPNKKTSQSQIPTQAKAKDYDKWADGIIVKNVCNNKKYKVKHDNGNIIEVFDNEHGYLIMARADLKVVDEV
ncbi:hypothetical protein [Pseudobutyrivibrio xylanivorans]|uniref:Uncharacterized protein n=1 Tax=Pseudobutyrivibrio xylanivorans DSM 14809 TaxID=1123012 RepID=A0A1M6KKW0_PSEXY|nr:hypothetical protein [Pseudobutyrivibrio xylanivorans]SHJ59594.1 hypothetical protein SAMN02745725_02884 [Pseudobutyrivibrio xylanivorans DSM 14809]